MRAKALVYHGKKLVAKLRFDKPFDKIRKENFGKYAALESLAATKTPNWHEKGFAIADAKNGCRETTDGDLIVVRIKDTEAIFQVEGNGLRTGGRRNTAAADQSGS